MYSRYLKLNLAQSCSAFLWGARKTGKSTYLSMAYPDAVRVDLLDTKLSLEYSKEPWRLREEILRIDKSKLSEPIIIDEIQKVPGLLDEIHWLIEKAGCHFILCGSSARQMKKVGVNMLGGRALKYNFYPLVYPEIKEHFDLVRIFNNGLIPLHFSENNQTRCRHALQSYIEDYLTHEIKAEGLVRNLTMFNRFLDSIVFSHGEMLNYSNTARDVGVDSKTVKGYYQILEDTLMGYFVYPYYRKVNRTIISSVPKFYLFDVGLANRLMRRSFEEAVGAEAGRSLEHYIYLELVAYIGLNHLDHKISYWRTSSGIEVDFIVHERIDMPIPFEIKISSNLHKTELKGMLAFMREHSVRKGYIVCMESRTRKVQLGDCEIIIYPLVEFLEDLWEKKLFSHSSNGS